MAQALSGGCLCGAVRFEIEPPLLYCGHCHCSMCRRAHGAAFVTWTGVPHQRFRFVRGAGEVVRYRSSAHATRGFCRTCGSTMFFESTDFLPGQIGIALASVEGHLDLPPAVHAHFDSKVDWIAINDGLPRLGGPSGLEPI